VFPEVLVEIIQIFLRAFAIPSLVLFMLSCALKREGDHGAIIVLSSMQVCYKCTDLLDDQILLTGIAPGGLTEVPISEYRTASCGVTLALEMGLFGFKPEVRPPEISRSVGQRCMIVATMPHPCSYYKAGFRLSSAGIRHMPKSARMHACYTLSQL